MSALENLPTDGWQTTVSAELAAEIPNLVNTSRGLGAFSTASTFGAFVQQVICDVRQSVGETKESERFLVFIQQIVADGDDVISTGWGGVQVSSITDQIHIEKYLVIHGNHYLALEKHDEKTERLTVEEGVGVLLRRSTTDTAGSLTVHLLRPGSVHDFIPGEEHCVIAVSDMIIFEQSTDPKGMDQDLIFIFEPVALG